MSATNNASPDRPCAVRVLLPTPATLGNTASSTQGEFDMKSGYLLALAAVLPCLAPAPAPAQPQYPIMDRVAQRVIQKYQNSSCAELAMQRGQRAAGTHGEMEERFVAMLRSDPQMRQAFLNRVAGPIANKLFECGMIP
jgi:CubicO group peptidase (beta-lactamase class C family)